MFVQLFQLRAEESATPVNLVAVPEVGWIESSKARPGKRYTREAINLESLSNVQSVLPIAEESV